MKGLYMCLVLLAQTPRLIYAGGVCCAAINNEVPNRCIVPQSLMARPPAPCAVIWEPRIIHVNITSTQVLLAWKPPETAPNDTVQYSVILNSSGVDDVHMDYSATQEWILLNGLEQSAYDVRICTLDCCCVDSFATGQVYSSPVTEIRVPLFNPLLDGRKALSAQIVWNPSSNTLQQYRVEAKHVNNHLESLPMSPYSVSPQDTYTTIVSLGTRREYLYPLQVNSTYLVRVGIVPAAMGEVQWSGPILFLTNGSNTLREVFVVSNINDQYTGELLGAQLGNEHTNLFGPLAVDVARRAVLYFDEDTCIQRCPYGDSQQCERLNGSCLVGSNVIVKAMAYDWIAEEIYIAAIDMTNFDFELLKYSERSTQAQRYSVVYSGGSVSVTSMQLTMNPFNGVVHWTMQSDQDSAVLNHLDLKAAPSLLHEMRPISGITAAIYSTVRYNCLLVMKTDGTLVSLHEDTADTTLQDCGSGAFSIASIMLPLSVVGFDDQGVYYFDNSPNQNIQFVPFWGFGGSPATIMQEIQGGLQSITGTSPGKQPLPLNPNCLSSDYAKFSNRPVPVLNKTSETSLSISWQDNATPLANCSDVLTELFSIPLTQYKVYVSNNSGPLDGYNPLVQYGTTVQLTNLAPSSAYSVSIEARNKYTLLNESGSDDLRGPVMLYEPNRDSITATSSVPSPSAVVSPATPPSSNDMTNIAFLAGIGGGAAALLLLAVIIIVIVILVACIVVKRNERKSYPVTADGNLNSPMYKSPLYQEPDEILPARNGLGNLHLERSQTIDSSHSVSIIVETPLLYKPSSASEGVYAEIGQPIKRCFTEPSAMVNRQFEGNDGSTEELLSMSLQPGSLHRPQPYQVHVPSRSATPHNGPTTTTFSISQEAVSVGSQLGLPVQPYEVPSRVNSPSNLSDPNSISQLVPINLSDPHSGTPPTPPPHNSLLILANHDNDASLSASQDSAAESTKLSLPNSQESAEDHIYSQLQHNKSSEALLNREKEQNQSEPADNPPPLYSSLSCEMTTQQQSSL